jgi:hypothetical protein
MSVANCRRFPCCTEDGGRSSRVGFQEQALNHPEGLPLRAVVLSVWVKVQETGQVRIGKVMNKNPI